MARNMKEALHAALTADRLCGHWHARVAEGPDDPVGYYHRQGGFRAWEWLDALSILNDAKGRELFVAALDDLLVYLEPSTARSKLEQAVRAPVDESVWLKSLDRHEKLRHLNRLAFYANDYLRLEGNRGSIAIASRFYMQVRHGIEGGALIMVDYRMLDWFKARCTEEEFANGHHP